MKLLSSLMIIFLSMSSTFSNSDQLNKKDYSFLVDSGITDQSEMKKLGEHMLKAIIVKSAKADAFIDFSDETQPFSGEFFIKTKDNNKKIGFNSKEIVDGVSADCFFIYGKQEKLCLSSKVVNNKLIFTSQIISIIDLKKYMPIGTDSRSTQKIVGSLVQTCNQFTRRFNRVETPFFSSKFDPSPILTEISPMDRPTFQTIQGCFYDEQKQVAIQKTALTTDREMYESNQVGNIQERQKILDKIFGND